MMFGEYLVSKNIINETELESLLTVSKFRKSKIGRLAVELNFLSEKELNTLLVSHLKPFNKIKYKELKSKIDSLVIEKLDAEFFSDLDVIPIGFNQEKIEVLAKQFSDEINENMEARFDQKISVFITDAKIMDLLTTTRESISRVNKPSSRIEVSSDLTDDEKLEEIDPYTRILKNCFEQAKKLGASDIHFEPYDLEYLIRFRVHGQLNDWKSLSSEHIMPITSKLKYIINMDLAVVGKPQDSRASLHTLGIDIRGSSMPVTSGGEKIVLRFQYQENSFDIRKLGLSDEKLKVLLEGIQKKDGLILISGPTGSGKTTTLYALLEEMDRLGKNISTLENPVEKQLARINQANIADHKDFDSFQRALMRQDPDVILLGEIRDAQTADLSLKLASTGHLVLSTIHANGAVEVVDRLKNLGADPFSIKSNLRLSIAQRLLRKICPNCSKEAPIEISSKLLGQHKANFRTTNLGGCEKCHKGVVGRIAVIEYLDGEEIKKLGEQDLTVKISLLDECLALANRGEIDVKDALY